MAPRSSCDDFIERVFFTALSPAPTVENLFGGYLCLPASAVSAYRRCRIQVYNTSVSH